MARPRKTGLDYFPFDVDFFSDEKVICIGGEWKIKGELTIIKLLCAIYRNGYYIRWNDALKYKLLLEMHGVVSGELLEDIIRRLVERGFFDEHLFTSESVLTSEGIQRRYFEAAKFRQRDENLPYLLVIPRKNYTKPDISQWETGDSHWESTQIKRNNRLISSDEDIKRKSSSPPYEEKNFLKEFFGDDECADSGRRPLVENLSRRLGFDSLVEMRKMAEEITEDWRTRRHTPRNWEDAAAHLVSAMKLKLSKQSQSANTDNREQLHRGNPSARRQPDTEVEMKERSEKYQQWEKKKAKPADIIRRYGYDPEKVTIAQVMNPEWREANPPVKTDN